MPTRLPWDSQSQALKDEGKYVRETSDDLYHTARWTRLSHAYRQSHPLCANCARQGLSVPAECTDHIVPMPICREWFYDTSNLQPLCEKCNHLKGQSDKVFIQQWQGRSEKEHILMVQRQMAKVFK